LGRSIGFRCLRPFELRGKEPPDHAYVSSSPLKFRTTGFPQYGFKLAFSRYDLQPRGERLSDKPTCTLGIRPYTQPPVLHCSPAALAGMIAGPIVRTFQSRGPWLAGGFCCPTRLSLLWPHLRLSSPSPLYGLWRQVHARRSALGWVREGPIFLCLSVPFVPSSVPRWMEWLALVVLAIPTRLHRLCTASASISPPSSVLRWTASRGCKVRFMLRPEEIASPSPTRTFTFELSPPESPPRDVEYSYAANQQFPRPDFHR